MQYLLNDKAITAYAEKFAKTVCDRFFEDNEKITGHEIVTLTPIKQVNFFIIKELFSKWNREAQSMESPFFDYRNEDVKKAMTALLNALSQNISIDRRNFEPLAIRATIDALTLMLAPEAYYDKFLRSFNTKISYKNELQPVLKYVKTHRRLLEELAEAIEDQGKKVPTEWAQEYVHGLLTDDSLLDDISENIYGFKSISPCAIEAFTLSAKKTSPKKPIAIEEDDEEDGRINYFENKLPLPASEQEVIKGVAANYTSESDQHRHIFDTMQHHLIADEGMLKLDLHEEDAKFLEEFHAEAEMPYSTPENDAHKHIFDTVQDHLIADSKNLHLDLQDEDALFLETFHLSKANAQPWFDAGDHLDTDGELSHDFAHLLGENQNAFPKIENPLDRQHREPVKQDEIKDAERSAAPVSREPEPAKQETPAAKPLFQKEADNDDETDTRSTLLDSLAGKNQTGKKLKGSIPLNLKFKFQNELFGGNGVELSQAIDLVDEAGSLHGAMSILKEKYVRKYNWDMHGEAATEFMEMVGKAKE